MKISAEAQARLVARNQSVVEKYKSGVVVEELAKMFFLGRPMICKILKEAGLTAPRKIRKDANKEHKPRVAKASFKECSIQGTLSVAGMETLINDRLKDGWTLQGGIFVTTNISSEYLFWQTFLK